MSASPPVSVLLPVRDGAPWLEVALASLRAQTFSDFEVCLQDDGSSDGSLEIARAVARRDPRVQVEAQEACGIVAALNRAAVRAGGGLLVRMDADDVSAPDRLASLVEAADATREAAFFASAVEYFPRASLTEGMREYEAWINGVQTHEEILASRFIECPMPHPAWAIRTDTFRALGGYRDGPFPEDYELFLRAVEAGVRFHKVADVLLHWREGGHRLSRNDERYALEAFFELKVLYLSRMLGRRDRRVVVAGAGPAGRRWARRLRGEGHCVAAFFDEHPGRIGQRFDDVRVHAWSDLGCFEDVLVLVSTGRGGGRGKVRARLTGLGWTEGDGFFCVQ